MSYKWYQNANNILISFTVSPSTKKSDVDVVVSANSIKAGLKGKVQLSFIAIEVTYIIKATQSVKEPSLLPSNHRTTNGT
jgi:hypothetical protein